MNKKIVIFGKVIAGIIGLGLLITSGFFLHAGYSYNKLIKDAIDAEPIRMKIDISKPGVYSGDFKQSFSGGHSEYVYIESPIKTAVLEGLKGSLQVLNPQEEIVIDIDISENLETYYIPQSVADYPGWGFWPFEKGEYKLVLTVVEPVTAFENVEQYLVARYGMCGLETLSVYILNGIGGVLLFVGLVISIVLIRKQFFCK